MITFENNKDLYEFDSIEKVKKSLDFAKKLPTNDLSESVTFHFYWRVPRNFSRKQVLPIKSAIATQNLKNVKIILWSNVDLSTNEYVIPLLPYIETKIWDLDKEANGTILANTSILKGAVDDPLCYLGGDIFRLLCLHKYGGVYVDMDVVILRDFNPILPYEFMYQWGSTGTHAGEPELRQNGAVMRLKSGSKLSCDLLEEVCMTPGNPNSTCWGTDLYRKVRNRNSDWSVFPCAWFNTEWGLGVPLLPFQKNKDGNNSSELFDGAFAWHWHNKWDDEIEDGSKFQILENIIEQKFKEMRK